MLEIIEVKTKRQQKNFIDFPLRLYKNNPYFVPPLYSDEKKLFSKNNIYCDQAETVYFNAYEDGKIVGRISGILQKAANEKWKQRRVRFTRFDSIDDQTVADALFAAVESWAKEKGMNEVVGPLGFSDLEREGLLIEGFDQQSTFEEQYNYEYYKRLMQNCGYQKEVDWVERKLRAPKTPDKRVGELSRMMMKKYKLHLDNAKNTKDFINRYADQFFEILDVTYVDLYGTVPFTPAMKKNMIAGFKLIVDVKYVSVILDENERVVGFGVSFPSIAKAVQKSGGKLTPAALVRLLKALKHPKTIDLALIGILPEYRNKGISTVLIWEIMKMLTEGGIEEIETNLNLEDNAAIINQWKIFDATQHKRRRCFIKRLDT